MLELPKLRTARDQNDEPSLVAWGKFLAATSDEELETLAMQNPVLKQAKDALDRLSADDEARMRAEQREMAQISYELDMGVVWREGNAAGKAEGKADLVQHARAPLPPECLVNALQDRPYPASGPLVPGKSVRLPRRG